MSAMNYLSSQRSNIRKARKRDPIVSVFMHDNPNRIYSITVPSSKLWKAFIIKIKKQFKIDNTKNIELYQVPLSYDNIQPIDINTLHKYDIINTNMSKIKHKYVFCANIFTQNINNNTNNNDNNNSSDSDNTSTSSDENKTNKDKYKIIDQNESTFGLDIDIFGRFCTSKKQNASKKKKNKQLYHYHSPVVLQSLSFHLKNTWLNLKTNTLKVKHINDKYTNIRDSNNTFNLRTRRIIWPYNLEINDNEFDYKLDTISTNWKWAILIIHGGKFAGAIYHGSTMYLHKTLRRYVIRKKQGKRQVNHMSTSGQRSGSAGGYKRSENEKKLLKEIREILSNWMDELIKCDKIFIHHPGIYNQITVYGNNDEQTYLYPTINGELNELLSNERLLDIKNKNKNKYTNLYRLYKKDKKIKQIPITTHHVTLKEIERVHYWLSTCWLSKIVSSSSSSSSIDNNTNNNNNDINNNNNNDDNDNN